MSAANGAVSIVDKAGRPIARRWVVVVATDRGLAVVNVKARTAPVARQLALCAVAGWGRLDVLHCEAA